MLKKILKIFAMILLSLLLCGQIFVVCSLIHNMPTNVANVVFDLFTPIILGAIFSITMVLLSLIKHKGKKIFLLGFWPVLVVIFILMLSFFDISTDIIQPEILFMFLMYIGLLLQFFNINRKIGYIGCVILFLFIFSYIYIRPAYVCERENGVAKCGGNIWDWDKKMCESKFNGCETIEIEENK